MGSFVNIITHQNLQERNDDAFIVYFCAMAYCAIVVTTDSPH